MLKRKVIITILIILYVVGMIGMFSSGVPKYIESKDNRLSEEIRSKLSSVFERDRYIDIAYSGYKVGYEHIAIPQKPIRTYPQDEASIKIIGDLDKQQQEKWEDTYGNLRSLYRIKYKRSDWIGPYDFEDGWNLVTLKSDYDGVYQTWIFPYAVGYIKQNYSWGYEYDPSVKSAVENAFQFYTTDNESNFISDIEQGSINNIWSKIYDCNNDYYYLEKDSIPRFSYSGTPLFEDFSFDKNKKPYQAGFIYTGLYKVFIAESQPATWTIRKRPWNPDMTDLKKLWRNWAIGLTILLLILVIPIWIVDRHHQKKKEETLYNKLMRLCNPSNFIKDYNKEKIDAANTIYQRLIKISPDDVTALSDIQLQAESLLGINLINYEQVIDLRDKVNPKNFMNPYNPEKVALANELYSNLAKTDLTYIEFIEIEKQSKSLL